MFKTINTLLLLVILTACSSQEKRESNTTEVKENVVKEETVQESNETEATSRSSETSLFTLTTLAGKTLHVDEAPGGLSFKEYKDKVVIVLFFGYRCPPCIAEIPVLKALTDKGHKDLEIVALEVQGQTQEQLRAFKKRKGINYTLVASEGNFEFIDYIAKKANWGGSIPFLIGFDKKSEVKVVHVGGLGVEQFDEIYSTLAEVK